MEKNRCFKMTAMLLATIMMFIIIPSFALGTSSETVDTPPTMETTELNATFVRSAKIVNAANKEVTNLAAEDPNGTFTLKLVVSEPEDAEHNHQMLPADTKQVDMYYPLTNVIVQDGSNDTVSWEYVEEDGKIYFDWKKGKQSSFSADIYIAPHYPASQDLSGSYVLVTKGNSTNGQVMLGSRAFMDGNRGRLTGSKVRETNGVLFAMTDEDPVWVLEHVTGDYYTVYSQNNGQYLKFVPSTNGIVLESVQKEKAQKILLSNEGNGYYAFIYQNKSLNNYSFSAGKGFASYNSNDKGGNAVLKFYPVSALTHNASMDWAGTWYLSNTKSGTMLTSTPSTNAGRLNAIAYKTVEGYAFINDEAKTYTFEHVNRDWYTIKTEGGYLNLTANGAVIVSTPQRLLVKTDKDNGILLTTGEFTNTSTYVLQWTQNGYGIIPNASFSVNTKLVAWKETQTLKESTDTYLLFNVNGGTASSVPSAMVGKIGEKVTLPAMEASKNGTEFIAWADVSNIMQEVPGRNGRKNTYHKVYKPGDSYTLKAGANKLYAVYNTTDKSVQFCIRKNGVIQDEPNNFDAKEYIGHFSVDGILKEGYWIVDIDSTKPVNDYYISNNVTANLNWIPSAEQIAEALKNEGNVDFDPETMYVHWYVLKFASKWKVDGVIRNKKMVEVTYNANVPEAERIHVDVPGSAQVLPGKEVNIGTDKDGTIVTPVRDGYIFTGWNTKEDGSGTSYSSGGYVRLNDNLNLYAQWTSTSKGEMSIMINTNGFTGKPAPAGTMIKLTAELTGFEGKTYTLQWQHSVDKQNWIDEPGANEIDFTYELTAETAQYHWRVIARNVK